MHEKKDYMKMVDKTVNRPHEASLQPIYRVITAQAVIVDKIRTESTHWNRYLELLQGMIERIKERRNEASKVLSDPNVWNTETMAKAKTAILCHEARIDALEAAMELPQALMDGKQISQDKIKEYEKKYGDSTDPKAA